MNAESPSGPLSPPVGGRRKDGVSGTNFRAWQTFPGPENAQDDVNITLALVNCADLHTLLRT